MIVRYARKGLSRRVISVSNVSSVSRSRPVTRRPPDSSCSIRFGQIAIARRAAHQAHPRRALENFFAFLLRHAAKHADHFPVRLRREFEVVEPLKHFLRGFFADAARVVEQEIRVRRGCRPAGNRARAARRPLFPSRERSSGSRTFRCRRISLEDKCRWPAR